MACCADEADLVESVDVATALRVPALTDAPSGSVRSSRVVDGRYEASNAGLGWCWSARWAADDFPWLCLWTEDRSRLQMPWQGVERTRGLELSTKPFPESLPPVSRRATFQGRPAECWIPADAAGLTKSVEFSWKRIM